MKIVITDAKTVTRGDLDLSPLAAFGELVVYDSTVPEELPSRIGDADALLCNKSPITRQVLEACPHLRFIGLFATGYNNIDTVCARERGIVVSNAGSYSTDSVAQQVFAYILHHANRVAAYDGFVQKGGWIASETFSPFVYDLKEIAGKTIGIFGFGSIGKKVAAIASAFGMSVLVCTRTERKEEAERYGARFVSFETLLSESDYLTVHCPLTDATKGIFDESAFSGMKPGCFFINTSRGGVLKENALKDAVQSGHLSGAAVDVLTEEPMTEACPLLGIPNLVITPHIAWAPLETRRRLLSIVCENLRAFIAGRPIHVVS